MGRLSVIAGKSSEDLAERISKKLKAKLVRTSVVTYSDGESKLTLDGPLSGEEIIVVQSAHPPVDTNLMQALSLVSRASEAGPRVTAVVPYLGYARQDREFLPGEIVTVKALAKLFKGAGASEVIIVDMHSAEGLGHFDIKTTNISAVPDLARHFKRIKLKNPVTVSPDAGGRGRAEEFAKLLRTDCIVLAKERDRKTGKVRITTRDIGGIAGADVILVDDMISTGGSIAKAAGFLKRKKCQSVHVACTHGLLVGSAEARIKKAGVESIVSTNTVPGRTAVVDVSGAIAKAIR